MNGNINSANLKAEITRFLEDLGADAVGFAPVDRWETGEPRALFSPGRVWPPARTAVAAGLGLPLPVVETTPSAHHMELYRTCNRLLDEMAYKTVNYLLKRGIPASFFPRDGFGSVELLEQKPHAAFDHRFSAYYAGLGNMGWNNSILTPGFGPRMRFVTVFLDIPLPPDEPEKKPLCIQCGLCAKLCPVQALKKDQQENKVIYDMKPCLKWHEQLTKEKRYPCGICIKVCPVGQDREIYGAEKRSRIYTREKDYLQGPEGKVKSPEDILAEIEQGVTEEKEEEQLRLYLSWQHSRSHGSWK